MAAGACWNKKEIPFPFADSWKSCNFAGRNKPGIRYDLPKVRAVACRFSTTYLLLSAACYNKPRADLQTNKSG